jgi:predicted acylesterase/phospholipase RssA/CRP-like cAMP-binding protein
MTMAPTRAKIDAAALREAVAESGPFSQLSEEAMRDLAECTVAVSVAAGERIIGAGVLTDAVHIIQYGRVRALIEGDHLIEATRGQFLMLHNTLAEETTRGELYAVRDSTLLRIARDDFIVLTAKHPDMIRAISRNAIASYADALGLGDARAQEVLNCAVLPLGEGAWTDETEASLHDAMADVIGPGAVLSMPQLQKLMGDRVPESFDHQERLIDFVHESQASSRFILLRAQLGESPWSNWCWHQADRTLVVARAGDLSGIERIDSLFADEIFAGLPVHVDLLLIHEADAELPRDSEPWLGLRSLRQLHHARAGHPEDFRRAVRRLVDRAVGVVLGGGGARGLAHIGVLQAIEDAGVPVDFVGGTSMGAVVAAAYARGWSPGRIMQTVCEVFAASRAVIDLTLPFASFLSGRKLDRILKGLFEDIQIEDLWIPYYCVSSSVTQARGLVHKRGPLWRSVRASVSLPGIFPPVQIDDQVLVDGGVMNNVPMDIMREQCPGSGRVIAVDVGGVGGRGYAWDDRGGEGVSGWRLLRDSLRPRFRRESVPSIIQTLLWSTTLSSKQYTDQMIANNDADLFLKPPVQDFGLLGFDDYQRLYDVGYEYASKQLAEWKR